MTATIDEFVNRPKRSLQEDGLTDIAGGVAILGVALATYTGILTSAMMAAQIADGVYPPTAYANTSVYQMPAMLVVFALPPLSFRAVEPLRKRFVYPRLGYVKPRVAPQYRWQMVALAVASVGLVAVCGQNRWWLPPAWTSDMTLVTIGIGLGVVLFVNYWKFGFARHLAVAGVSVIASLALAAMPLDSRYATIAFVLILSASLFIAGATAFAALLRTSPGEGGNE